MSLIFAETLENYNNTAERMMTMNTKNKEGKVVLNVDPYSLEEARLMSDDVQRTLKDLYGMVSITYLNGEYTKSLKNRYTMIFSTRDQALEAAEYLHQTLQLGVKS